MSLEKPSRTNLMKYYFAAGELGNSVEEVALSSIEANELKNASTPMSGAVIMPSPVFLWRFKVSF